jgi:microcystin-dependent protein
MDTIKRIVTIVLVVLLVSTAHAQTGIGTSTPNASAKLEVAATDKGFLPPRISLTGVYDQTTIPSPATGLLVYCKGDAGLSAGYYFWNGTAWATIATAGGSGSVAAEFGENILATNVTVASTTPVDVLTFTLPSAGTWEVITFMRAQGTPSYAAEFALYDATNVVVPNSEILTAYGENASTGTGIFRITTTGLAVFKVKAWATHGTYNATTDNNGRTGVTWKKISGNAPVYWEPSPPIGSVVAYAGSVAPSGYLLCDGSAVSRSTYAKLFAIIGTTYGSGNGSTTFNVPDLRGRVAVGKNAGSFASLGSTGGEENHTMTINEMPAHKHTTSVNSDVEPANITGYAAAGHSVFVGTDRVFTTKNYDSAMQTTGGGAPFNNLQPYIVLNQIIKY